MKATDVIQWVNNHKDIVFGGLGVFVLGLVTGAYDKIVKWIDRRRSLPKLEYNIVITDVQSLYPTHGNGAALEIIIGNNSSRSVLIDKIVIKSKVRLNFHGNDGMILRQKYEVEFDSKTISDIKPNGYVKFNPLVINSTDNEWGYNGKFEFLDLIDTNIGERMMDLLLECPLSSSVENGKETRIRLVMKEKQHKLIEESIDGRSEGFFLGDMIEEDHSIRIFFKELGSMETKIQNNIIKYFSNNIFGSSPVQAHSNERVKEPQLASLIYSTSLRSRQSGNSE